MTEKQFNSWLATDPFKDEPCKMLPYAKFCDMCVSWFFLNHPDEHVTPQAIGRWLAANDIGRIKVGRVSETTNAIMLPGSNLEDIIKYLRDYGSDWQRGHRYLFLQGLSFTPASDETISLKQFRVLAWEGYKTNELPSMSRDEARRNISNMFYAKGLTATRD